MGEWNPRVDEAREHRSLHKIRFIDFLNYFLNMIGEACVETSSVLDQRGPTWAPADLVRRTKPLRRATCIPQTDANDARMVRCLYDLEQRYHRAAVSNQTKK